MDDLLKELPAFIITVMLLVFVAVLLVTKTITATDPLVNMILGIVAPFWFLRGAYQWQPAQGASTKSTGTPGQ